MEKQGTLIRSFIPAGKVKPYAMDEKTTERTLELMGISVERAAVADRKEILSKYAQDAAVANVTTPSVTTPIQFLQHWLAEVIEVVTAAREIDDITGRTIAGRWEDENIVQTVLERTGQARPYGDHTDIPLASWNTNFETRDIVRFEQGSFVGILEEARAAAMNLSSSSEKRNAAAESLAIELNNVGFFGYNEGNNKTYGFLNDPNLPAYVTVATGASTNTTWATKTYAEITADIRTAFSALRTKSGNLFKPERDASTISLPVTCMEYLNVENSLGRSVYQFIKDNYPNARITSAVQLDEANGGANVFYIHADRINNKRVMDQYVQEVFKLLGVEKTAKGMLEDYTNATAGVLVAQPIGVVRYTGI